MEIANEGIHKLHKTTKHILWGNTLNKRFLGKRLSNPTKVSLITSPLYLRSTLSISKDKTLGTEVEILRIDPRQRDEVIRNVLSRIVKFIT